MVKSKKRNQARKPAPQLMSNCEAALYSANASIEDLQADEAPGRLSKTEGNKAWDRLRPPTLTRSSVNDATDSRLEVR